MSLPILEKKFYIIANSEKENCLCRRQFWKRKLSMSSPILKKGIVYVVASSKRKNYLLPVLKKGILYHRQFWKRELFIVTSFDKEIVYRR